MRRPAVSMPIRCACRSRAAIWRCASSANRFCWPCLTPRSTRSPSSGARRARPMSMRGCISPSTWPDRPITPPVSPPTAGRRAQNEPPQPAAVRRAGRRRRRRRLRRSHPERSGHRRGGGAFAVLIRARRAGSGPVRRPQTCGAGHSRFGAAPGSDRSRAAFRTALSVRHPRLVRGAVRLRQRRRPCRRHPAAAALHLSRQEVRERQMGDLPRYRRQDLLRPRRHRHRQHLRRQRHQAAHHDHDLPAHERDADLVHRCRSMRRFALLSVVLLLAGCAAEEAYHDGVTLMDQGRPEESMAKFEEALAREPHDVQYRSAWLAAREHALVQSVEQADKLAGKGAYEEARRLYRHALSLDPAYERAIDGLAALDARIRQAALLDEADTALTKGQSDVAAQKVARVLTEAPNDPRALGIKRKLEARQPEPAVQKLADSYKKPITIEFKDVSLKQVFEVLSHSSGLNFLFDKDVKTDQHTSIFLKNSTIEAAVRFVLLTNQLEQQVMDGNTVLIYPNNGAKQKDYQELDVRTFYLANAEAKTVANTLKTILKVKDIAVDEKLNMIVLRETPDAIRMAEKLVAVEDVADPEVMLDVEVLEVQRTWLQDLGIQWPASATFTPTPLGTAVGSNTNSSSSGNGSYGNTSSTASTTNSTSILSLHDLAHQTSRSVGVSVGGATANANLQDSHAKLLTNPRIRVRNHDKAKILIGERVPNITSTATSTGFLSQSVSYIDVGLTLNVEPTIYLDDNVGIKLSLEVSSIINTITTQTGTTAYEIGTRNATTALRLKNGETDVLAGLIGSTERTSGNKLPGLGELPVLGRLFGATTDDDEKTEIVLAITPHLVRNVQRPDAANALFNSGTETSLHAGGGSGGGGSAAPAVSSPSPTTSPAATMPTPPAGAGTSLNGTGTNYGSGLGDTGLSQTALTGTDASNGTGEVAAGGVPAAGIAQMQWQGNAVAAVGGTVTLSLVMQSTQAITSLPMTIGFDPARLEVVNIAEGPFLRSGGSGTSFTSRLGNGQLTLSDVASSGAGATAEGVFVTVTFRALAAATSTSVQLLSAAPTGIGNVSISLAPPAPFSLQITQ